MAERIGLIHTLRIPFRIATERVRRTNGLAACDLAASCSGMSRKAITCSGIAGQEASGLSLAHAIGIPVGQAAVGVRGANLIATCGVLAAGSTVGGSAISSARRTGREISGAHTAGLTRAEIVPDDVAAEGIECACCVTASSVTATGLVGGAGGETSRGRESAIIDVAGNGELTVAAGADVAADAYKVLLTGSNR